MAQSPPDVEDLLSQFDQAWWDGEQPRIEDFCPPSALAAGMDPARRTLLEELIKIDLEHRWRQAPQLGSTSATPEQARLEDYVGRFPELGPLDRLPAELIAEEYRARHFWGDRPAYEEYATRFARQAAQLRPLFAQIDAELLRERPRGGMATALPDAPAPVAVPVEPPSVPALLGTLRTHKLLEAKPLEELERLHKQGRLPTEPKLLGQELLQRGWLTPYQVNQLLQGRGADLVLGPYLLLERLGGGGTGQVFKARHMRLQRDVALKLIRKELLADPEVMARFDREIRIISRLSHPNIVHAYDAGPIGSAHLLVMEYLEGIDLARLVKQSGPLPAGQACAYIRQAALGLQHAHEQGLVHRDIKPANLLVSGRVVSGEWSSGQPPLTTHHSPLTTHHSPLTTHQIKILDLGLARLQKTMGEVGGGQRGSALTSLLTPVGSMMMGTPDYLAPEQAIDFHGADARADIYSLGCTLYSLLTGEPPFPGGSPFQKLMRHQQAEPADVAQRRSDLPPGLRAVLQRMMAKRPEDRYQTAAEVAAALEPFVPAGNELLKQPPPRAIAVGAPAAGARSRHRRHWRLAVGVAAAGLLLFLAGRAFFAPKPGAGEPAAGSSPTAPTPPALPTWLNRLGGLGERKRPGFRCWRVAFGPDSQLVAVGISSNSIYRWVVGDKEDFARVSAQAPPLELAANGLFAAWNQQARSIAVWDLTRDPLVPLAALDGYAKPPRAAAFAANGGRVAATDGSRVRVWNLDRKNAKAVLHADLPHPEGGVMCLALSPTGGLLASASQLPAGVMLWDVDSKQLLAQFERSVSIHGLTFSADARKLVGRCGNQPGFLAWDIAGAQTGANRSLHNRGGGQLAGVVFTADGHLVGLGSGQTRRLLRWSADLREQVEECALPADARHIAVAPDGRHFATAQDEGVSIFRFEKDR
jgi:serine/threonine-protein kinase